MMNTQLSDRLLRYITAARGQQLTDQTIHDELVAAGWDTGHVQAALADAGAAMRHRHRHRRHRRNHRTQPTALPHRQRAPRPSIPAFRSTP